ncbi:transporter [Actinobacillus equuli]|nr:transporter [Actinobacillus equuli]
MASMAVINLVAILILAPIVWRLLKDYIRQIKAGQEPVFKIEEHQDLIHRGVDPLIWKSKTTN